MSSTQNRIANVSSLAHTLEISEAEPAQACKKTWTQKIFQRRHNSPNFFYLLSCLTVFVLILIILLILFLGLALNGKFPAFNIIISDKSKSASITRFVDKATAARAIKTSDSETCGTSFFQSDVDLSVISSNQTKVNKNLTRNSRIIRGTNAVPHSQPWLISLRMVSSNGRVLSHKCGGALISDQHVLTGCYLYILTFFYLKKNSFENIKNNFFSIKNNFIKKKFLYRIVILYKKYFLF